MSGLRMRLLAIPLLSALILGISSPEYVPVIAHEWGTFTTVAAEDGTSERWLPLGGVYDLPCFVEVMTPGLGSISGKVAGAQILRSNGTFAAAGSDPAPRITLAPTYEVAREHLLGTVRMETPVIYFYAPEETVLRVTVDFPDGLVTEWYPRAQLTHGPIFSGDSTLKLESSLRWNTVEVLPDREPVLLREASPSHYYPARETDAAPIRVNGADEKFLFYRGVGDFEVPIEAVESEDGTIEVANTGPHPIPTVILFESRDGRIGYRALNGALEGRASLPPVALTGDRAELSAMLKEMILSTGMYEREADAMLATWEDSWFEEGARLFYLLPQPTVDEILPLTIGPAPTEIARAFVGRVELLTRTTVATVQDAIARGDETTILKYGRFLSPISERMEGDATPEIVGGAHREMTELYRAHVARVERACR